MCPNGCVFRKHIRLSTNRLITDLTLKSIYKCIQLSALANMVLITDEKLLGLADGFARQLHDWTEPTLAK